MTDRPFVKVLLGGNPGNVMFMYMTAMKLQRITGARAIAHVRIPMFGIDIPDISAAGLNGLHFFHADEPRTGGRIAFDAAAALCRTCPPDFIQIEGYCQHTANLIPRDEIDYDTLFPRPDIPIEGGSEDELVISIRGGEILRKVQHPNYTQVPASFYGELIRRTGLRPVFFGQLSDNPYCNDLRRRFPDAVFRTGTSPAVDFDYIRQSRNIVPSVSSFAWLAAWLSRAERIFLPLTGMLNPNQQRSSFYLPFGDRRYEYTLFPINYWLPIDRFRESEQAMEGRWMPVDEDHLRAISYRGVLHPQRLERYARHLDADFYVQSNPGHAAARERHGDCAVYNHYLSHGFREGAQPFAIDRAWYCRTYPEAAMAISRGEFFDEVHHFVEVGAPLGYQRLPGVLRSIPVSRPVFDCSPPALNP